jgi:hypothetical protein
MKRFISLLVIIPSVFLLSSCQQNIGRKFNDSVCQAPCWGGITMGTRSDKAIELLNQMSEIDQQTIKVVILDRPDMQKVINWKFKNSDESGNIIINNDVVSAYYFPLLNKLSLSAALKIYGNPDYVLIEKQVVDVVYSQVYLIYNAGICLEYQPQIWPFADIDTYRIKPNDHIDIIYYSDPLIDEWPIRMCNIGFSSEDYEKYLSSWKGFLSYPAYQVLP